MSDIGLFQDVPEPVYRLWPGLNQSLLKELLATPADCLWSREHPKKPTDSMRLGTAIHTAILQPEVFNSKYFVLPEDFNSRTKEGKEFKSKKEAILGEGAILKNDENETIERCKQSVLQNRDIKKFLDRGEEVEASGRWYDPATRLLCKGRFDLLCPSIGTVVDLKTTLSLTTESFARAIYDFGYHIQAAFYLAGLSALGANYQHYVIVVVEKTPPFKSAVFRLTSDCIEMGRLAMERLMTLYKFCEDNNDWPGYVGINEIGLPYWANRKMDDLHN